MNVVTTGTKQVLAVKVRVANWHRDARDIVAIEQASFSRPWSSEDFRKTLGRPNTVCLVAEAGGMAVGFLVYEVRSTSLWAINMAVQPVCRRHGVGQQLMAKVLLDASRRSKLSVGCVASEYNLEAHLFLRAQGFQAKRVLKGYYLNDVGAPTQTVEDGYEFLSAPGRV
jgi:[ribosomal protein S18]-alanine N-acetyltransferase